MLNISVADPGVQIRSGEEEGGGGVSKNFFFVPSGPQFGLKMSKNKVGSRPPPPPERAPPLDPPLHLTGYFTPARRNMEVQHL